MAYTFHTAEDRQPMLDAIGAGSIEDLFARIPAEMRLSRPLDLPPAMSELELTQHLSALAARNGGRSQKVCFLGGGSYDHFVPAVVDALASRGEFYTSYTPYQPEVSQGNLQVMFEYQTLICQLTGMDVSNASLYDGGSAAVEAVLMCMSVTKRPRKVVAAASVHPEYRQIIGTYFAHLDAELVTVGTPGGTVQLEDLERAVDDQTACVLVQHPNFFGCLEDVAAIAEDRAPPGSDAGRGVRSDQPGLAEAARRTGGGHRGRRRAIAGDADAVRRSLPGDHGVSRQFLRRMPGRIAGQTVDRRGRRCWVLTLQTREQHIRREKATSNICTNQGLFALRAAIYLGDDGAARTA